MFIDHDLLSFEMLQKTLGHLLLVVGLLHIAIGIYSSCILNMGLLFTKYIVNIFYSVTYICTLFVISSNEDPFFILT